MWPCLVTSTLAMFAFVNSSHNIDLHLEPAVHVLQGRRQAFASAMMVLHPLLTSCIACLSTQDAKALKVRWRGGEQALSPPQVLLPTKPFKRDIRVALTTAICAFVLLSSTLGEDALACMAPLLKPVGLAAGFMLGTLGCAGGAIYAALATCVGALVHGGSAVAGALATFVVDTVPQLAPLWQLLEVAAEAVGDHPMATALVGVAGYSLWDSASAAQGKPKEWGGHVKRLVAVFGVSETAVLSAIDSHSRIPETWTSRAEVNLSAS